MGAPAFEAWLAGAADEVSEPEFCRIVRLQVAAKLRDNQSPLRQRDSEVSAKWFGSAVALRDPSQPDDGRNNRVVGFRPSAVDLLDEWVRYYEDFGIVCQLDVAPSCFTEHVREALGRRGFLFQGAACTSVADPRALPLRAHPDVKIEDVTPDTLGEVLELLAVARGRPPATPELIRARQLDFARSSDTLISLARVDGEPAAVASAYFHERAAYFAHAVTSPAKRRRGCQAALLDHRVRAAVRRGCDLVVTDTLIGVESQRNVERAGLRVAFSVGWWSRARA